MNNYILIKNTGLKVELKAKDGLFNITVNRKRVLQITDSIERLFVYWIYGEGSIGDVSSWLRDCWKKDIAPMEIDEIITSFKKSHPAKKVDDFEFCNIPLYATKESGLSLPIPRTWCVISKENEQALMRIIIRNGVNSLSFLKNWFCNFRKRYGLDFQKQVGKWADQDEELAVSFLNQHGLSSSLMTNKESVKKTRKEAGKEVEKKLFKVAFIIGFVALAFLSLYSHSAIPLQIFIYGLLIIGGIKLVVSIITMLFKQ